MSMARAIGLLGIVAITGPVHAAPPPAAGLPCPPPRAQIFIAPTGEPFRAPAAAPAPVTAWFAGADADHDGRLTEAEMVADADRFFARLDLDHDGEIAPDELAYYENKIAPEIRLYQSTGWPGAERSGKRERRERERAEQAAARRPDRYEGALGAGRYAWLNIPEPVAAADADMNRGVSRDEFRAAAASRFRRLDTAGAKVLTLATLPQVPGQAAPCPPPANAGRRGR